MRQHTIQLLPITVAGIEAVNANSDISFGRHTHDQFGIGLMDSGGQKSLSGRGYVESNAGDISTVNPGEVHDGTPLGGPRASRMLYFDTELINRCFSDISDGKFASGEFTLPVFSLYGIFASAVSHSVLGNHKVMTGIRWGVALAFTAVGIRLAMAVQ
ncbi:AraC family ligand binding domain-containing protein [Rouxiella silvae]|uniref:AraC family ligand binding domain-containing protein n=1 Tax=Rouxiella silvae TaxID=1646373 RepID=UPI000A117393|nr:AraC family ligand binding domain-containing protein [Rouxiella silvae]